MLLAILLALVPAQQQCAPELCTGAGTTACPTASGIVSKPTLTGHRENVYFRNSARYPAEISKVGADGVAVSYGSAWSKSKPVSVPSLSSSTAARRPRCAIAPW